MAKPINIRFDAQLFDALMELEDNLIALHTADPQSSIETIRSLAKRSGQAVYEWDAELGLRSLKAEDIHVPGSRRLNDAMRYVLQSMHYGVYIFTGFERHMRPPAISVIRQISRIRSGAERKVIFVGDRIRLPMQLSGMVAHVMHDSAPVERPRLRDGKWVF